MNRILNAEVSFAVPTAPTAEPQVEVFDLHGRHILCDANSLLAVEVSAESAAYVREREAQPEALPHLNGALFCRQRPQWRLMAPASPSKLVLLVTTRCNLACRYCFVRHGDDRRQTIDDNGGPSSIVHRPSSSPDMSVETALKALDLIKGEPNVSFFGGEPLLNWHVCLSVAEEAKHRSPKARLHVTTNATLITPFIAQQIRALGMSVLVSLDGPRAAHEAQRGRFDATMDGLARLKAAGVRPFLRATFDEADSDLACRYAWFADIINSGLATGVSIEPAVLSEGCGTSSLAPGDLDRLAFRYHELAEYYVAEVREFGKPTDFPPFRKMIERLLYTRHAKSECGAGVGYLAVAPDGAIHACHKGNCAIGHLDYGVDEAARAPWQDNRSVYARQACAQCWARYVCGGGCRHHRLALSGDVNGAAPAPCWVRQLIIKECLWILAELGPDTCREFIR